MTRRFAPKPARFHPFFNVNNFFEISISKPENFLTGADGPYHDKGFHAKARPDLRSGLPNSRFSAAISKLC
jgi:hypothetical protein